MRSLHDGPLVLQVLVGTPMDVERACSAEGRRWKALWEARYSSIEVVQVPVEGPVVISDESKLLQTRATRIQGVRYLRGKIPPQEFAEFVLPYWWGALYFACLRPNPRGATVLVPLCRSLLEHWTLFETLSFSRGLSEIEGVELLERYLSDFTEYWANGEVGPRALEATMKGLESPLPLSRVIEFARKVAGDDPKLSALLFESGFEDRFVRFLEAALFAGYAPGARCCVRSNVANLLAMMLQRPELFSS